jgi:E3 ubiquitin-protein ligase MARCH6
MSTEELVCRVCHSEGELDRPLYYPCKCDGSIKYVHQDCLVQWLRVKYQTLNDAKCELCGEKFRFRNIYANGQPPELSLVEFSSGLVPIIQREIVKYYLIVKFIFFWIIVLPVFVSCSTEFYSSVLYYGDNVDLTILFPNTLLTFVAFWISGVANIAFVFVLSFLGFQFLQFIQQV